MHTLWSVWAPPQESSVLTAVTYAGEVWHGFTWPENVVKEEHQPCSGTQFGNIVTMPLGGFLCAYGPDGGWPFIFYLLGEWRGFAGFLTVSSALRDWSSLGRRFLATMLS